MHPTVSVVIPTRNNATDKRFSLYYVLAALHSQQGTASEIIIVDDCGKDDTIDLVTSRFPSVRVLRSDHPISNVGVLRNLGAAEAKGGVIVFLDDDTVLPSLETLCRVAELAEIYDFGCGAYRYWSSVYWNRHVNPHQSVSSMIRTLLDISVLPRGINRYVGFRDLNEFTFIGSFGFVVADVFRKIGGFDPGYPGWGFEDTDLMMRLCLENTRHTLLCEEGLSAIHLTHTASTAHDYFHNMKRFNELERERGYYFHANHFFGVYEADGYSLLTPISQP